MPDLFFKMAFVKFCWGWPQILILPISTSQEAGIAGMNQFIIHAHKFSVLLVSIKLL
jgi:hypothetical protein